MEDYDFTGWATRNNLKCADGRTIMKDAFKHNDGQSVPLVWNHQHDDPFNVLGHAILENREDGVYTYGIFNDTEAGQEAKKMVQHKDVTALSIYANHLKQQGGNVMHGAIREVSLVLAGANPGAFIDSVISHGEESDEEGIVYTDEELELSHADDKKKEVHVVKDTQKTQATTPDKPDDTTDETVADVFDTLTDKQKTVVYAIIGQAIDDNGGSDKPDDSQDQNDDTTGGKKVMKHNIFENDQESEADVLQHNADVEATFADVKRFGSLKESAIQHGITNIDYMFPDAQNVTGTPTFITRDMGWVQQVMAAVHHTPFSRIKSMFADITEDEARALGYIKGKLKKEEVFSMLRRTTTPQTVYKKQKLDRDDVVDITDFDVVSWMKSEMRVMLDEEIARAILIGDGRLSSSEDKINETNIRPIWKEEALYVVKVAIDSATFTTDTDRAKEFIKDTLRARKNYKGSGDPYLYTTEDVLVECLLIEDTQERRIYVDVAALATALRVKGIITVPVMENQSRIDGANTYTLMGIIVNLTDYNVGADKGGAVNLFDDFDIDYNAQKYLIETRCSGALIKPASAIIIESKKVTV